MTHRYFYHSFQSVRVSLIIYNLVELLSATNPLSEKALIDHLDKSSRT